MRTYTRQPIGIIRIRKEEKAKSEYGIGSLLNGIMSTFRLVSHC